MLHVDARWSSIASRNELKRRPPRTVLPVAARVLASPCNAQRSRGTSLEALAGVLMLVLAAATITGLALGFLGGGGSTLSVPILAYLAGLPAEHAITGSLFVVAVTSAIAAMMHARAGNIRWRTGFALGIAGMAGSFVGGLVAGYVPGHVLLIAFAGMMGVAAAAMLRRTRPTCESGPVAAHRLAPLGFGIGAVTGLVGAGGGFVVVPCLVLFGRLRVEVAIGTSLVVIAMQSFAGLAGHLQHVDLEWGIVLPVAGFAVAGSVLGARLSRRVSPSALRRAFAAFLLVMAIVILVIELVP
jgi:uncharacterized protein